MAFLRVLTIIIILGVFLVGVYGKNNSFNNYYKYLWGNDHFMINPQGTQVQLKMDQTSGAGFRSKLQYGSGVFHIKMKIPNKKTGGIITSFYLTSLPDSPQHFELDFEFFGTNGTLQTNVFLNDEGHREQAFRLWFDPSQDFHTYGILWNPYMILFTVDNIPLRVHYNSLIQPYPNVPMHVEASIWNPPPEWGWPGPVIWQNAPFIASYSGFPFDACPAPTRNIASCYSERYPWNKPAFAHLSRAQKVLMAQYRKKYVHYDYCSNPNTRKVECSYNDK